LLQLDRLGYVVERARLQGRHGVLGAAVRGDDCHREVRMMLGDVLQHSQAVAVREPHVGQAQVVVVAREQLERLRRARGAVRIEPHARERHPQELTDVGLVVDDQHLVLALIQSVAA
jgi:hypothetical protein